MIPGRLADELATGLMLGLAVGAPVGLVGLIIMYLLAFLGPFFAPNEFMTNNNAYSFGGPSNFTFIAPNGRLGLQPYMYPMLSLIHI